LKPLFSGCTVVFLHQFKFSRAPNRSRF